MTQSLHAFYELGGYAACAHNGARLLCDLHVPRWYVECLECGAAGPVAATAELALAGWSEVVELAEVLDLWQHAAAPVGIAG